MPISTNKIVACKVCGKHIRKIRIGDALNPKEVKLIYDSYCAKCEIKKYLNYIFKYNKARK